MATNQFDFIKGRYILESMVAAHEIIHDPSIILKLDYMKKAYDRVNWGFLEEVFTEKWSTWIKKALSVWEWMTQIVTNLWLAKDLDKEILLRKILIKAARHNLIEGMLPDV